MHLKSPDIKKKTFSRFRIRFLLPLFASCFCCLSSIAQECPYNLDFETGGFDNWRCWSGSVAEINGVNSISLYNTTGPVFNQHTMYNASQLNELDPYGFFPVNCPNGSNHSIRLGNDQGGGMAEGISYEFTIPANQNIYSLIYHYAVVFQDPNHQEYEQPRLEIEITNLTDNQIIYCSSFTFIPYGSLLPGFYISPVQKDSTNVWCKDWSAVSINLNGNAGKRIRLFFKTADCTFVRHFGYAYIDINTECSSEFVGATYCPDDTAILVTAPFGYQNYTWYNTNFTQVLGSQQTISFTPPPPVGTTLAVELNPYNGYGCMDTLYALLIDTLTVTANAGKDAISCNQNPVPIGANSKPGLVYSWSPTQGLSNPNISNPRAGPALTTEYILTTSNYGGGCASTDTVLVTASIIDPTLTLLGKEFFCITNGDSAVLSVLPTDNIQWYRNNIPINGANGPSYNVTQTGSYYASLLNNDGCSEITNNKSILIEEPTPGARYPDQFAVINFPQQLDARNIGVSAIWAPPLYLNNPETYTPVFNGPTDIEYTITIKTAAGCVTVDTLLVKTVKEVKIYVPTAFTPNNDGLNDYLKPIPAGIKELKYFRIYNRWGQLVFDLKSNPRGWDGTIGNKVQGTQVFVWMAEGIGVDNSIHHVKGTALLIR